MTGARRLGIVLTTSLIACTLPVPSAGQEILTASSFDRVATSLAQAELAFDRGDHVAAERGYAAVLALEPSHPRALFRLAQLRLDDPDAATVLLQQYVEVEPADAWGHLALADAFARASHASDALQAYARALLLEPEDRDIRLGRPRLLGRLGRIDDAIDAYQAWLAEHPADGEVWRELAAAQQRAGRPRGAARALERAQVLAPNDTDLARGLQTLRVRTAPAVQVGFIAAGETGVSSSATSIGVDLPAGDQGRVGVQYERRRVGSFGDVAQTQWLGFRASGQPRADIRLNASGGARWISSSDSLATSSPRPDLAFRIRRSGGSEGLSLDARVQRDSIDVTPELVRAPVSRTQVVAAVAVPVGGPWQIRGQGRAAALTRPDEGNRRMGVAGGVGVAVAPELRLSGQWHQRWNSNPAARGYFAPATAEVAEFGVEFEREYDRATIAIDGGGGVQRFQRTDQLSKGSWAPTLRVWGLLGWRISLRQQLLVEFESYNSQVSDTILVADRWRYAAVTVSLRVALR